MAAATAGSIQVDVGLRSVLLPIALGEAAESLELRLESPPHLATFAIPRATNCPFHGELLNHCVFVPADSHLTVVQLLNRAHTHEFASSVAACPSGSTPSPRANGVTALLLDWPLVMEAKCRDCSTRWEPVAHLARFRRFEVCPSCSSRRLVPIQVVHRITRDSPFAARPLRGLGMPDRHIYNIEVSGELRQ